MAGTTTQSGLRPPADWSGTRKQCDVRTARLNGPIAQALFAQAPALFAAPPAIERYEVIGAKV